MIMVPPRSLGPTNAFAVPVDATVVADFAETFRRQLSRSRVHRIRPYGGWNSDLEWLSTNSKRRFHDFEKLFVRLGIADHVRERLDLDEAPRVYSGFVLQRSYCDEPHFHCDWKDCDGQGWTFITPISPARPDFGLLFKDTDGEIHDYRYQQGEGVLMGDDAIHSPMPCAPGEPLMMLCFTFGTDRMHYWPTIGDCHSGQSVLSRRADGAFIRDWTYSDRTEGLLSRAIRKARRLLRRA